jgi:transposase
MGNRRCSDVREKEKELLPGIQNGGCSPGDRKRIQHGRSVPELRGRKKQLTDDPQNVFPGKGKLKANDEELRQLKRELDRVKEERDILKKALAYFAEDQK